jgi:glucose dehydrogenase
MGAETARTSRRFTVVTTTPAPTIPASTATLQRTAAGISLLIAALYGLIWAGALTVVTEAEPGELGILGVAGLVFLALAALLWRFANRALWIGATVLQVGMIWMYVAIGAERDPAFEVWGLTIRVAQVALIGVLTALAVRATRRRRHEP